LYYGYLLELNKKNRKKKMSNKQEVANTVVILLSLDRVMGKDLMKLEEATLNKIYAGYLQNAKNYNHIEDRVRDLERENLKLKRELENALQA